MNRSHGKTNKKNNHIYTDRAELQYYKTQPVTCDVNTQINHNY